MLAKAYSNVCQACAPWGLVVLRIVLGAILINHGYVKLFGESAGLLAFFESTVLPMPGFMLLLAGAIEFFGGILLVLGLWSRLVGLIVALEFLVVVLFIKLSQGFTALEFELLILAVAFAISSLGSGAFSLEAFWKNKGKKEHSMKGGHGGEAIGGDGGS